MECLPFRISKEYLNNLKSRLHQAEKPFKHLYIDNFFPLEIAKIISKSFPDCNEALWNISGPGAAKNTGDRNIEKLHSNDEDMFPWVIRDVFYQFHSSLFIRFLEKHMSCSHLIPDPSLKGCGLHSTGAGGRLMVHIDGNRYYIGNLLDQKINVIYYATPEWNEEWGGHLELWDSTASSCVKKISPKFNRLVAFDTSSISYHGHPIPLNCPPGIRRNSLAAYFYEKGRRRDGNYKGMQQLQWAATSPLDRKFSKEYIRHKIGLMSGKLKNMIGKSK